MKTKTEIENEIKALQAQLDAMPDDCDFVPRGDEIYYFVSSIGTIEWCTGPVKNLLLIRQARLYSIC
jgi:hypothetical protein